MSIVTSQRHDVVVKFTFPLYSIMLLLLFLLIMVWVINRNVSIKCLILYWLYCS